MEKFREVLLEETHVEALLEKERGYLFERVPILHSLTIPIENTKDLWGHTKSVCALVPAEMVLRLAALFHDIGKPVVYRTSKGSTFANHDVVGAEIWADNAKRFSNVMSIEDMIRVEVLIRNHMHILAYLSTWGDKAVRSLVDRYDGDISGGIALARADGGREGSLEHLELRLEMETL